MITARPETTHALVVGIDHYGGLDAELDGPVRGARNFADWLLSRGVPGENIRLHLAPSTRSEGLDTARPARRGGATEHEIHNALQGLRGVEGSFLYVYWSGHGFEVDGRLRMLVADCHPAHVRNLDLDSLLYALRTSDFARLGPQAVLVDTCRVALDPNWQRALAPGTVTTVATSREPYRQLVLLSAQPNRAAAAVGGTGVFTDQLLLHLRGSPADEWPADLERVAAHLHPVPDAPDAARQIPALWRFRGYLDDRDEQEILGTRGGGARGRLTSERARQLVELLRDCPEMCTPEGRERVLERMHRGADVRAAVERLPGGDAAVDALVEACQRWPDGVMDLVGAVYAGAPDAPGVEALERAVPAGSLGYRALALLWPILQRVDLWGDPLLHLYRASLPPRMYAEPAAATVPAVVRVLADMTRQDGSFPYPVLEFVERVAEWVGESTVSARLRRWVDSAAADLGLEREAVGRMRDRVIHLPGHAAGSPGRLLVALRRRAYDRDAFFLRAWYWTDPRAPVHPLLDTEVRGAGAAGARLAKLLGEIARDPRYNARELEIEFFLERDMLGHPVDEWPLRVGGTIEVPVGTRYSCVLRSLDRTDLDFDGWDDWKAKWTGLLTRLAEPAADVVWLASAEECQDPDGLYLRLLEDDVLAAGFPVPPPEPGDAATPLDALVASGTPVGVWAKRPLPAADGLAEVLGACAVADLSRTLRDHRRTRRRRAAGPCGGSEVALLWDDPSRLPPANRLRQPSG